MMRKLLLDVPVEQLAESEEFCTPGARRTPADPRHVACEFLTIVCAHMFLYRFIFGFVVEATYEPVGSFGQYHGCCAAMLLRHDGNAQWNYDTCDTFWWLVKL
jgi:hypothetical protein